MNYKNISFSWIHDNNKKLLGLPNNSFRKNNLRLRLLKKLKEENIRKLNSNSVLSNSNNNPDNVSILKYKNNLTYETSDKFRENALRDYKKINKPIKIKNLKLQFIKTKDRSNIDQKFILNNNIKSSNSFNENNLEHKRQSKTSILNFEKNINNMYKFRFLIRKFNINNISAYQDNRIKKIKKPIFENNIFINTFNIDKNFLDIKYNSYMREIQSKNKMLHNDLFQLKNKEFKLSKNFGYKRPFLIIDDKIIINNKKENNFYNKNIEPNKVDLYL